MTAVTDTPPPLNLDDLNATDVPPEDFGIPDHKQSEKPKRNISDLFNGVRAKEEPKSTARKTAARKTPTPRAKRGQFKEPLMELYTMVGTLLVPFDPVCGNAVIASAEKCAESLDDLAYQNEAVRRALLSLTTTSAWGVVMLAHMPIIMAVAMHHVPAVKNVAGNLMPQPPAPEGPGNE